jgi:hypothetical protein
MIGEKARSVLTGFFYSLFAGPIVAGLTYSLWRQFPFWLQCLTVSLLVIAFYFVGVWVVDRKAELNKKIATPSHELRRRRKEFYDWLSSPRRR